VLEGAAIKITTLLRAGSCHALKKKKKKKKTFSRYYFYFHQLKKSTEVSSQGREKELGEDQENDIDDEVEWEDMFVQGPGPKQEQEWGGPTRGGRMQEPTRFGDWERKGRCTDF